VKTPKSAFSSIADALSDLGSHDIYDVKYVEKVLREAGYQDNLPKGRSSTETNTTIDNRGLGGTYVKNDSILYIGGYEVSNWVASNLGVAPVSKMGRGSQHRSNIAAIREAGNV
jgi:hypothetical protein